MRIAAIYDLHANLPALEAVLADIRAARVDQIVVGGDVIPGPMPRESLDCLLNLKLPVQFIYGNGEVAVLEQLAGREPLAVPEQYRPVVRWTAQQIDAEQEKAMRSWPKTLCIDLPGMGTVLFCHGTPRDENESFTKLTSEDSLLAAFAGVEAALVVCGHTHMQFDRRIGNLRVVNAGSAGMPFGKAGAYWLLLDHGVQLCRIEYDLERAAACIRASDYPDAENFAARSVLKPPTEAQMLDVFARAERK